MLDDAPAQLYDASPVAHEPATAGLYDVAGIMLPALLFAATIVVAALVSLARRVAGSAPDDITDIVIYGGLSLAFGYIPYLTGYAAFRIAALAANTSLVMRVAAASLSLSLAIGAGFLVVSQPAGAIMFVLVLGIPSLAGVIACSAQTKAGHQHIPGALAEPAVPAPR